MAGLAQLTFLALASSLLLVEAVKDKSISSSGGPMDLDANAIMDLDASAIHDGQFLLVSSPEEKKVVWTALKNFKSADGRAFALVDTGLDHPKGLAFDKKRGHLYIADSGAKKIFRYTVLADTSGSAPTLTTSGVRLTISEGHPVEWLTIDHEGNLFYTAPDTNNINKIEAPLLREIAKGEVAANMLQIISQKTLMAESKAKAALDKKRKESESEEDQLPTDAPPVKPHILSIYEAKMNPQVSQPTCIVAHGDKLFWTNGMDGMTAGTVVQGAIQPENHVDNSNATESSGPKPFPATALTKVSPSASGLAVSEKVIFFTRENTESGNKSGIVSGLLQGTDIILDFVKSINKPRGLVWDRDQTMYVADESGGAVWSFPTGRMMQEVPLTRAVVMKGAYGLALLSNQDPCFKRNEVDSDGKMRAQEQTSVKTGGDDKAGSGNFLEKDGAQKARISQAIAIALAFMVTMVDAAA